MPTHPAADAGYGLGPIHHVGLVVADLEQAAAQFHHVYGTAIALFPEHRYSCRVDGELHLTTQRMALSTAGPPYVELLRSVPGSPVWTPTAGIHHLGFVVDDLVRASNELASRGAPPWMTGGDDRERPSGACYHRDPLGHVIELLDRATAERLAARARCATGAARAAGLDT